MENIKNIIVNLMTDGKTLDEAVKAINDDFKANAVNEARATKNIYQTLIDGAEYPTITASKDSDGVISWAFNDKLKTLKASDALAINTPKAMKENKKAIIANDLHMQVGAFAVNLIDSKTKDADLEIKKLKVYSQYMTELDCFVGATRTSNNQLEKQFNAIILTMLGEGAEACKKKNIKHIKDSYIKATSTGYGNGNIIKIMQCIIDELAIIQNGNELDYKSKLACHKEPKNKSVKALDLDKEA